MVGVLPPCIAALMNFTPSRRPTSHSVASCAMRWRITGSSRNGLPSRVACFT